MSVSFTWHVAHLCSWRAQQVCNQFWATFFWCKLILTALLLLKAVYSMCCSNTFKYLFSCAAWTRHNRVPTRATRNWHTQPPNDMLSFGNSSIIFVTISMHLGNVHYISIALCSCAINNFVSTHSCNVNLYTVLSVVHITVQYKKLFSFQIQPFCPTPTITMVTWQ